jgi:hypothetical protein
LFCHLWLLTSDFRLLALFSARPDQLITKAIQIKAKPGLTAETPSSLRFISLRLCASVFKSVLRGWRLGG